jgi:hypothetical protein
MTKKRWVVLAGMLVACVCLTLAVLALLPPRPGVTPANFERIEDGMTHEEVEKILGGPGVEIDRLEYVFWTSPAQTARISVLAWEHRYDGTYLTVRFDRHNRVIQKDWAQSPPTFMQKLKRLLHL